MIIESVENLAILTKEESLEAALDEANTLKIRGAAMDHWRNLDRVEELERRQCLQRQGITGEKSTLYQRTPQTGRLVEEGLAVYAS